MVKARGFYVGVIALGVACLALGACRYGLSDLLYRSPTVKDRAKAITDVDAPTTSGKQFTALLITDIHFGSEAWHSNPPLDDFLAYIDSLIAEGKKPAFVAALGDLTDTGRKDDYQEYTAFTQKIEARGVPVYSVLGNHDILNDGWSSFKTMVRPYTSYYRFKTGVYTWYFLDTANGTLGANQLDDFLDQLEADSAPKIVLTHYPVYSGGSFYFSLADPHERAILLDAYAKNKVRLVIDGHRHYYSSHNFGSFKEYSLASLRDTALWYELSVDEDALTLSLQDHTD